MEKKSFCITLGLPDLFLLFPFSRKYLSNISLAAEINFCKILYANNPSPMQNSNIQIISKYLENFNKFDVMSTELSFFAIKLGTLYRKHFSK